MERGREAAASSPGRLQLGSGRSVFSSVPVVRQKQRGSVCVSVCVCVRASVHLVCGKCRFLRPSVRASIHHAASGSGTSVMHSNEQRGSMSEGANRSRVHCEEPERFPVTQSPLQDTRASRQEKRIQVSTPTLAVHQSRRIHSQLK